MPTHLYILGTGIRDCLQLTAETRQALSACRRVFVLHADLRVLEELRSYCPDIVDLAEMYDGREVRRDAYHAIAARVVGEASPGAAVAFVVHGHPLFLVSASEYIIEMARAKGLQATVLPAVSSLDTLLCDLKTDLAYAVQMFDTTTLLDNGWVPNPQVPMLLFQLATTREGRVVRDGRTGEVLRPIVELLVPLYGSDHVVTVMHSAAGLLDAARLEPCRLGELATTAIDLTARPTLYVPAAVTR